MTATGPTAGLATSYITLFPRTALSERPSHPCGKIGPTDRAGYRSGLSTLERRSTLGQQTARLAAARSFRPAASVFDDGPTAARAGAVRIRRRGRPGLLSTFRHAVAARRAARRQGGRDRHRRPRRRRRRDGGTRPIQIAGPRRGANAVLAAAKSPPPISGRWAATSEPIRNLCIRYNEVLLSQARVTAACNALHSIEARFCRWLLQSAGPGRERHRKPDPGVSRGNAGRAAHLGDRGRQQSAKLGRDLPIREVSSRSWTALH